MKLFFWKKVSIFFIFIFSISGNGINREMDRQFMEGYISDLFKLREKLYIWKSIFVTAYFGIERWSDIVVRSWSAASTAAGRKRGDCSWQFSAITLCTHHPAARHQLIGSTTRTVWKKCWWRKKAKSRRRGLEISAFVEGCSQVNQDMGTVSKIIGSNC